MIVDYELSIDRLHLDYFRSLDRVLLHCREKAMNPLPPVYVAFELVSDSRDIIQQIPVFVSLSRGVTQDFVDKVRTNLPHTEFVVVRCIPGVIA